jgi:hypothetical protein
MSDALIPLLSHPDIWRASRFQDASACQHSRSIPTGFARLDRELPEGGWPHNGIFELLLPQDGQGELPLLAPALAQLSQQNRWLAWVAPPWLPYAPALARHGIRLEQVLLIRPTQLRDCLWAMEQCLSSGACAAVLGWPTSLQPQHIKRLQLAAQHGQCMGVLMRDRRHSQSPSPAPLRIELDTQTQHSNGQMQCNLRLIKRRGRWASDWFPLQWSSPLVASWQAATSASVSTIEVSTPLVSTTEAPATSAMPISTSASTPT